MVTHLINNLILKSFFNCVLLQVLIEISKTLSHNVSNYVHKYIQLTNISIFNDNYFDFGFDLSFIVDLKKPQ